MSEDIAFKIQLGLFLSKLEATVKDGLTTIIEDHVNLLNNGTLEGERPASMRVIKEMVMKNLEIFLDNAVLPPIEQKLNPPKELAAEADAEVEEAGA